MGGDRWLTQKHYRWDLGWAPWLLRGQGVRGALGLLGPKAPRWSWDGELPAPQLSSEARWPLAPPREGGGHGELQDTKPWTDVDKGATTTPHRPS